MQASILPEWAKVVCLREFVELPSSWPLRVLGRLRQGVLTPLLISEFHGFRARVPRVPGRMSAAEQDRSLLLRQDRLLLLRQDRCLLLRQDRCLLLRQDRCPLVRQGAALSHQFTSVLSQQKTSALSQHHIVCVSETGQGPDTCNRDGSRQQYSNFSNRPHPPKQNRGAVLMGIAVWRVVEKPNKNKMAMGSILSLIHI